jgi:hypothetical protein
MEYSFVPIGLSARLLPVAKRGQLAPYVAAGVDLVVWQFREHGDYFDFESRNPFFDRYRASGATSGLHVAAGLRIPLSYDFALTSEVRYLWTHKVTVGDDYLDQEGKGVYDIQPGGLSATLGLNLRF